jgi:hypothetical protein
VWADYEAGEKMLDIYARHQCTKGEFDHHRREAGWPMRNHAPVNRERMTGRILWLINRHLAAMERQIGAGSATDIAALSQLVAALLKLQRVEAESAAAAAEQLRDDDLQDIRDRLVRRVEELKRK